MENNKLNYFGEYFLGIETHKYYNKRRSFYREFLEGKVLQNQLKKLKLDEIWEAFSTKAVWNAISLTAIGSSVFMKKPSPLYTLIISEGCRCLMMGIFYYTRKIDKTSERIIKNTYQFKKDIEKIADEGEEWRNSEKHELRKELDDIMSEWKEEDKKG